MGRATLYGPILQHGFFGQYLAVQIAIRHWGPRWINIWSADGNPAKGCPFARALYVQVEDDLLARATSWEQALMPLETAANPAAYRPRSAVVETDVVEISPASEDEAMPDADEPQPSPTELPSAEFVSDVESPTILPDEDDEAIDAAIKLRPFTLDKLPAAAQKIIDNLREGHGETAATEFGIEPPLLRTATLTITQTVHAAGKET